VRSAALAALNGDAGGASIKRRVTSGLMSASRHEKMRAQRMRAMDATRCVRHVKLFAGRERKRGAARSLEIARGFIEICCTGCALLISLPDACRSARAELHASLLVFPRLFLSLSLSFFLSVVISIETATEMKIKREADARRVYARIRQTVFAAIVRITAIPQ